MIDLSPEAAERLARIRNIYKGSHWAYCHEMCIMEAVAFVAGEKWSDEPDCVSPVIVGLMRRLNDMIPRDTERTRVLLPLVLRLMDSRCAALEEQRFAMLTGWCHANPTWLTPDPKSNELIASALELVERMLALQEDKQ